MLYYTSMRLRAKNSRKYTPSYGASLMFGLSSAQMEQLAEEIVDDAEDGLLTAMKETGANKNVPGRRSNLIDSVYFASMAAAVSENADEVDPQFSVNSECVISDSTAEVRRRMEERLEQITQDDPTDLRSVFSRKFLHEFDWILGKRRDIVSNASRFQREFVQDPTNPLKLHPYKQADVARRLELSNSTVCRLIQDLHIQFPDGVSRDVDLLIPGKRLQQLQGRHALNLLKLDPLIYNDEQGWLYGSNTLSGILSSRYGLNYAERTIRKYQAAIDQ